MTKDFDFYKYGREEGQQAARDTDWLPGEMKDKYESDNLGEVVSEILVHWQQDPSTIYYDEIQDEDIEDFEEGFYAGFEDEVKKILHEVK